ncbi:unnamed protein product [Owenia fusiformis]|uniref:Uncharacterized protein n=1 Tax=Owenia fusiformis TaxID=6347 RepID=A0A8J1XFB4_OWEFU|nr:unnamed protein product [Owenia fusiformis]
MNGCTYCRAKEDICQNNERKTFSNKGRDGDKKDEGYAWIIVMSCFLCHTLICGISFTVGVTFVIFLDAFGTSKGATALVGSLNTASVYAVGPISSVLTNRFGCRPVVLMGGIMSFIGLGTSAFATNIYHLYITFGIITGRSFS